LPDLDSFDLFSGVINIWKYAGTGLKRIVYSCFAAVVNDNIM
jgi:hypothetical protein